jgi:uncharacterized metal-binding protein YceD (DUF177 family)
MKIRVSDISPEGLKINDTIPLKPLNDRLKEGNDHGILFLDPPHVEMVIHKTPFGAETRGKVRSRYKQPCGLCMKDQEQSVELDANYIIKRRTEREDEDSFDDNEDDVGLIHFDGEHVDLENIVQETLILSLSIYWTPEKDENDACVKCGLRNKGDDKGSSPKNSMADLLKKAGLN